jgi:maltose O-acetyltransferase
MGDRTEKQKMLAGVEYSSIDPELEHDRDRTRDILLRYNQSQPVNALERGRLLHGLFRSVGVGSIINPHFWCDYGYNITLGNNVFINYNCVFLDCAPIRIDDNVMLGPSVQLYTSEHSLDLAKRRVGIEIGKPIHIEQDVWIGGAAVILQGISIGEGSVVGAGSVVTGSVPALSIVAGNPARVIGSKT